MINENCPCKRVQCERHGNCKACYAHHHMPGKKMGTTCERLKQKKEKEKGEAASK